MGKQKHTIRRIPIGNGDFYEDRYNYRGYEIQRNDETPSGYYGRWKTRGRSFDYRRDCIAWIDSHIAEREIA